ncbi:MAG: hypothetical protein WCH11_06270 [Bdellovibrio sp.]
MKNFESKIQYKKMWKEIKQTDPWRYDLNEDFYVRLHDRIMDEIERRPTHNQGKWWGNWRDWRSWRTQKVKKT